MSNLPLGMEQSLSRGVLLVAALLSDRASLNEKYEAVKRLGEILERVGDWFDQQPSESLGFIGDTRQNLPSDRIERFGRDVLKSEPWLSVLEVRRALDR